MIFNQFKKKVYSQHGEDGIIEEILKRLDKYLDYTCCEFGAWDGFVASNTLNLIKNKNYSALLIESNKEKFQQLCKNIPDNKITKLNKFVEFNGKNSLDNLLKENNFNKNFDFLSCDIDGNDYHMFESLSAFRPKLICIEFNNSIPNDVNFVQKKDYKIYQGCSPLALISLGAKKNYTAVAATHCNLFFVDNKFKEQVIGENIITINDLIDDTNCKNYVFMGEDGSILTSKKIIMTHHFKLVVPKIKFLPKYLEKPIENYNFLEKFCFYLFLFYRNPMKYLKNPFKYIPMLIKHFNEPYQ